MDRRLAYSTNETDLKYTAAEITPLSRKSLKNLMFISFWLRHVPVILQGSRITKDAPLKSGAVKVELTARIGEMSAAVSFLSPTMCENLIYSFISLASA